MEKVRAEAMRWMVSITARVNRSLKVSAFGMRMRKEDKPVEWSLLSELGKINDAADI